MQAPVLILYRVRFARCGCCAGGLERKSRRLAGGRADNGEPTSRPPVPGRGHLFQQGSPPSPPWCVRPGTPSFLSLHQKRNRQPVSGSPVGTKISTTRGLRLDPIEPCLGRGHRQRRGGWSLKLCPLSPAVERLTASSGVSARRQTPRPSISPEPVSWYNPVGFWPIVVGNPVSTSVAAAVEVPEIL